MEQYDGSVLIDTKINTDGADKGTRNLKSVFDRIVLSAQKAGDRVRDVFSNSMKEVTESSQNVRTGYNPQAMEMVFGKSAAQIKNYAQAVELYGQQAGMVMNKLDVDSQQAATSLKNVSDAGQRSGSALKEIASGGEIATNALNSTAATGETSMVSLKDSILWAMGSVRNTLVSTIINIPAIFQSAFTNMLMVGKAALNSLGKLALKAAGQLENLARSAMKSIGKVAISLLSLRKHTQKQAIPLTKSILKLSNMFKLMLIRMAMRNVIQGVREGFQNLARYSDNTNKALSALMSSLTKFKNSIATAFTPILEIAAPAISKMISALADLNNWIGQTLAALAGKDTFVKAVAVQEDYAASLSDTQKAAKSAAKEVKKATFAFDTLIQAQKPDADTEYKGPTPDQMFKTVEIAENVQKSADKIRELLNSEDFSGIGELLGQKINEAISRFSSFIDWNNVGGKITQAVNRFVSLFNSLVSTINWDSLGRMVGKGINTIVNTLYLLLNGIDWVKLGEAFAKGLNGLVYEVDWEKFGATIGSFIQAKIDLLYGFVTTADWPAIGKALADGVMGLVNRIDWARFGETMGKTLSGIISSLHKFINTIDWTELGKKISTSLNNFFSNVDWADLGQTLSDFALGLLETLRTVLKETDWEAIGEDIGVFLSNIDWWGVFMGVIDVVAWVALAVIRAQAGILWSIGKAIWEGITKGITEFSEDPSAWIKKHIVDPFVKWIKELFGIHSPSTVMAEIGSFLMAGLIQGLDNSIGNLTRPLNNISEKIKSGFQSAFDGVKNIAANAINAIIDILNRLKFDVPDWVPEIGGKSFGFNIKRVAFSGNELSSSPYPVSAYSAYANNIPRLATGTVVPPKAGNFLAMLGDNNRDYEVVSPLGTIKQAVLEALGESGGFNNSPINITMELDGTAFAQLVYKYNNKEKQRVGVRMVTNGG